MKIKQNKKDNFSNPASGKIEISEELQSELSTLSKMANNFSPKPLNPIEIPEQRPFSFNYMTPVMACSLALLLVFFTYKIYVPSGTNKLVNLETIYQEIETDEIFMDEVNSLVEEIAYSDFYPETTTVESKYDFSDDFIEVIVPI